jgi:hypothetical protein
MAGDHYEPNRFLGIPRRPDGYAAQDGQARHGGHAGQGGHARQGEEPQRVMGFPVDWFGRADLDWFRSMAHPVRTYRRWVRRRRLGPYAVDEDEPRR